MSNKVLIVEDEASIREMLGFVLEQNDYTPIYAEDYPMAVEKLAQEDPALVLLDWMIPGGSGVKFAKLVKGEEKTKELPIIMITARGEEDDKVKGLDAGADDYITKPFSPKELLARVKAVMRRAGTVSNEDEIKVSGLHLDPVCHRVTAKGELIEMGPTEFKLLHFFMTHLERVYSREQLLDYVWGTNVYVEDRTVDVHIRRLRKAISMHGHDRMIQTVRGAGYRFSNK